MVRIPPPRKVIPPWPPSRSDIEAAFVDLLAGSRTREDVADWAVQGLIDDDLVLEPGWEDAFEKLGLADYPSDVPAFGDDSTDLGWLFPLEQFAGWLEEFRANGGIGDANTPSHQD